MTEILGSPEEVTPESKVAAKTGVPTQTPNTIKGQDTAYTNGLDVDNPALPPSENLDPIDFLLGTDNTNQKAGDTNDQSTSDEAILFGAEDNAAATKSPLFGASAYSASPVQSGDNPLENGNDQQNAVVPLRRATLTRAEIGKGLQPGQQGEAGAEADAIIGVSRTQFQGTLLTALDGALKIAPESRGLCALFDTGVWLVSSSHKNSPLVTSVAAQARRQGFKVNDAIYVTPDVIKLANIYAEKAVAAGRLDENQVRRKIVETIAAAKERGANDIHIESLDGRTKVEFRIDGLLRVWETWTQKEGEQLLASIWSHASTQSGSTANWLEPQNATISPGTGPNSITFPDGVASLRCQWMPLAEGGRYLNMRMSYDTLHGVGDDGYEPDVDSIGFSPEQTALISRLRKIPGGMRIVAGPTNQGKTTTLRIMLNRRMSETHYMQNCLLIEDPPEGGVRGARQIGMSAASKADQRERTFQDIMRATVRLDPNILMLGEVRDPTTAGFVFKLALTGSQVYSTTHVYSALAIPQRLRDIGVEPYLVYEPNLLRGLVSQRLCRTLCTHCRIPIADMAKESPAHAEALQRARAAIVLMDGARATGEFLNYAEMKFEEPDLSQIYTANKAGCPHCGDGRKGRTATGEVIETDAELMRLLAINHLAEAERYWLSPHGLNGMNMLWHGLDKVRTGICGIEEVEEQHGPLASPLQIKGVEDIIGKGS